MNLLTLRNVSVDYDGFRALDNVDLTIDSDDFLGVVGPNGGGKTTLVKTILGTLPYTGEISRAKELFSRREPLIGYLPQQISFDRSFPISVIETVLSGLQSSKRFLGRYRKEDRIKALGLLQRTGIEEIGKKPIGEISGGQMQRALLCRAIISDPRLLILDEPANYVDSNFQNALYALLRELNQRMAIVMVSHDAEAMSSVVKGILYVNRSVQLLGPNLVEGGQAHE